MIDIRVGGRRARRQPNDDHCDRRINMDRLTIDPACNTQMFGQFAWRPVAARHSGGGIQRAHVGKGPAAARGLIETPVGRRASQHPAQLDRIAVTKACRHLLRLHRNAGREQTQRHDGADKIAAHRFRISRRTEARYCAGGHRSHYRRCHAPR